MIHAWDLFFFFPILQYFQIRTYWSFYGGCIKWQNMAVSPVINIDLTNTTKQYGLIRVLVQCVSNVTKDWQRAFVFNIFILLFSLFLFVLKFILCLLDLFFFFFFFLRLRSSNASKQKSPKMISCCTIHLADNPIGFTRVPSDSCWSETVWGSSILTKVSRSPARFKNTLEYLLGWKIGKAAQMERSAFTCQILLKSMKYKCTSVYLTLIQ